MHPSRRLAAVPLAVILSVAPVAAAQTRPLPLPKGQRHSVRIDSSPQQAAIYVNSKEFGIQGYTPSTLKLPKGTYKFILELQNFKPIESTVEITRSQAFTVALERMPRPAILDVRAGSDQSALGGTIIVDGTTVGTLPNQVEVAAGNHLVEVKRAGYADDRESVQVAEGERRTLVVNLVAQARPGDLIVMADVPNAEVWVDGTRRDTVPALVKDLAEGPHTVEVRREGSQPWKQMVNVIAGQQSKVMANLAPVAPPTPPPPVAGTLKVLSATPLADVFVDGDPRGPANSEIRDVRPGMHIVEVRAQGYASQRSEVQVGAGELRVVEIDLKPEARQGVAGLRVISAEPEVEVFIDGASVGRAPIERNDLPPGRHYVVAHKAGFSEFKAEVELEAGKGRELAIDLRASGSLRVITAVAGADVYLDGNPVGRTPLTLDNVPVGDHLVELKMRDFVDARETVRVEGGAQRIVQADLQPIQRGPTAADIDRTIREQSSLGATTIDRGRVNVNIGAGWPYFFDVGLITGILRFPSVGAGGGLDLGIDLRTNYYETSVGLRPRLQILRIDPFAFGVDMLFSGGGGPQKRDTFTYELGALFSLIAGQWVHINFRPYLMVSTDRLCPSIQDIRDDATNNGTTGDLTSSPLYKQEAMQSSICMQYDLPNGDGLPRATGTALTPHIDQDPRTRFITTRFMLQGSVEVAFSRNLSAYGLIEGAPGQPQRQSFTGKFNGGFPTTDFPLYGRAGIILKF
jgi:hypothetical protein